MTTQVIEKQAFDFFEPLPTAADVPPHPLHVVINEDGEIEYQLEHPNCPSAEIYCYEADSDEQCWSADQPGTNCAVRQAILYVGLLDALGVVYWTPEQNVITHLKPGEYVVTYWEEHYPSGPWGGDEWDSGLNVEPLSRTGGES